MSVPAPAPSEPPARPVRATWAALHGTPVRAVLELDTRALERPLRDHLVMRCTACGVVGVDVYEREGGPVCALCDVRAS